MDMSFLPLLPAINSEQGHWCQSLHGIMLVGSNQEMLSGSASFGQTMFRQGRQGESGLLVTAGSTYVSEAYLLPDLGSFFGVHASD